MKRSLLLVAVAIACTSVVRAQNNRGDPFASPTPARSPAPAKQMYEDIEVMRHLLARNLQTYTLGSCKSCHETNSFRRMISGGISGLASNTVLLADFDADGYFDVLVGSAHP